MQDHKMQSARQVAGSLLIALISLAVVIGGVSLSIAEGGIEIRKATDTSTVTIIPTITLTLPPGQTVTPVTSTFTPTVGLPTSTCLPPQGWIPITIEPGQTLEALALTYNTSVETLMQANCLVSPDVPVGSTIYVPAQATRPVTPIPTRKCGPPPGWIFYYIQSGDTLYSIATRYNTTVPQLMVANCLTSVTIVPGQPLYVPNVATITPPPTLEGMPSPTQTITIEVPSTPTNTVEPTFTDTPQPTNTEPPPTLQPTETPTPSG
jgi:LysM repeat protein